MTQIRTKQRLYQIQQKKKGNCIICGKKRAKKDVTYCKKHRKMKQEHDRQQKGCGKWKAGGPGRPPLQ